MVNINLQLQYNVYKPQSPKGKRHRNVLQEQVERAFFASEWCYPRVGVN